MQCINLRARAPLPVEGSVVKAVYSNIPDLGATSVTTLALPRNELIVAKRAGNANSSVSPICCLK